MHQLNQLNQLLIKAQKVNLLGDLLVFLLTPGELDDLYKRLDLVAGILDGTQTQRELSTNLGISIAKVTRGSNELKRCSLELKSFLEKQLIK